MVEVQLKRARRHRRAFCAFRPRLSNARPAPEEKPAQIAELLNDERCAPDPVTGKARIIERDAIDVSETTKCRRTEDHRQVTAILFDVPATPTPAAFTPQRLFDRITKEPGVTPVGETSAFPASLIRLSVLFPGKYTT